MKWPILLLLLAIEIGFFTAIGGNEFGSISDLFRYLAVYFGDLFAQAAPILLLGFGMTLVLMIAGIDLSIASMTALVACVMSSFDPGPDFWWKALPVGLITGLALGSLNGLLIARLDVPPIVATLGTMIFFRGCCFLVLGDEERSPFFDVPGYEFFGQFKGAVILVGSVFLLGGIYFYHSRWRREILMMGGNRIAARYAAIPVTRRTWEVYALVGLLSFFAALCFTGRNSSVSASSLTGLELHVIVAVVLGGTRIQGGHGSLIGTFFGVLFVAVLDEGLRGAALWGAENLPFKLSHIEYILMGVLLIGAVWLSSWGRRHQESETGG